MGMFDPGMGMIADALRGSPSMPAWKPISLQTEQGKAIASNQANMPAAESQTAAANLFSQDQITKMMEQMDPNFLSTNQAISGNISAEAHGQIPADVQSTISRSGAATALSGGYAGSGMHSDLVARDLGLTSLQLTNQAMSSAESWMSSLDKLYAPGMMNVSSMFVSPEQMTQLDVSERDKQFQYNWGKNLMDWQSSFGYSAANEIQTDSAQFNQMAGSVLGSVAGGAMGGMG